MYQFGPLQWEAMYFSESGTEPACIDPQPAPRLWARQEGHNGFVLVYWARTTQCSHEEPLAALPAHFVRRLME